MCRASRILKHTLVASALVASPIVAQPKVVTWKATQLWRVDGSEIGEPFGDVLDFVVLKDGALWALEHQYQIIRRYDANGKPLGTVGRKGSGPGEFRNANGMLVTADGSVWINDHANSRFTIYNGDGKFARQLIVPMNGYRFRWLAYFNDTNGELVEETFGAQSYWRRINASGKIAGTLATPKCPSGVTAPEYFKSALPDGSVNKSYPFTRGGGLAPDRKGNAWCAATFATRAALIRVGPSDTIARTTLEIPNEAFFPSERSAAINELTSFAASHKPSEFDAAKVPNAKPGIAALSVDDDGRLWLQHPVSKESRTTDFDVFAANGNHLFHISIPGRIASEIVHARGDALWLLVKDADDVLSVAKFRIGK